MLRQKVEQIAAQSIDFIDPFLRVQTHYQLALRQREQSTLAKAAVAIPLIFIFIYLNALIFNDVGKSNPGDWLRYRVASIVFSLLWAILGFLVRRSSTRTKLALLFYSLGTIVVFSYGMTLGYSFRSQWMSYYSAPILAIALRSPLGAAAVLALGLFLTKPIWGHFHEARLVMTEYEFTCLFILLAYFWRRLWISKVIAEIELRSAESQAVMQQQELYNQIRTFVAPVLVKRIEGVHKAGSSIADALDSVLRLRLARIAVFYSDLRDYSRKSSDRGFVEQVLIPSASKIIDLSEANESIARIIADGVFCFYSNSDPEESLLRALRDAWICAETEFSYLKEANVATFSRHFTVTYGEAYMGNIGSKMHKDTSVIGKPANLAARIDDLTKREKVKEWIGVRPHVLLSFDAIEALKKITPSLQIECLDLKSIEVSIRSYEEERSLGLLTLTEENALILGKVLALNDLPALRRGVRLW